MHVDAYFAVARERVSTSAGEVELPILYYDVEALYTYFLVPRARARAVLAGSGYRPVSFAGRALVGLAFYIYRDTSIGPYNEVGTAVAVVPEGSSAPVLPLLDLVRRPARRAVGFYILDLPVSTPIADAAGRELWGYPKFVTDLPIQIDAAGIRCSVVEPGSDRPLLTLTGTLNTTWPMPSLDLLLYSERRGERLRTEVDARGSMHTGSGGQLRLELGPGEHRMVEHLRALGLDDAQPLLGQHAVRLQTRLHAGSPG